MLARLQVILTDTLEKCGCRMVEFGGRTPIETMLQYIQEQDAPTAEKPKPNRAAKLTTKRSAAPK